MFDYIGKSTVAALPLVSFYLDRLALNRAFSDFLTLSAMATLAYTSEELTQPGLNAWFGEGVAVERTDIVDEFRAEYDADNAAVFFKLFEFPDIGLGVISIRGTSNNWDMLADSQLWSAAALMQGIRFILPAGELWTPILDREFLLSLFALFHDVSLPFNILAVHPFLQKSLLIGLTVYKDKRWNVYRFTFLQRSLLTI